MAHSPQAPPYNSKRDTPASTHSPLTKPPSLTWLVTSLPDSGTWPTCTGTQEGPLISPIFADPDLGSAKSNCRQPWPLCPECDRSHPELLCQSLQHSLPTPQIR